MGSYRLNFGKWARFVIRELVYSGHLQAFGSVGIVFFFTTVFFDRHPTLDFILVTYLKFQAIYYFDRYKDIGFDETTNVERSRHIYQYIDRVPVVIFFYLFFAVLLTLIFGASEFVFVLLLVVGLGVLYTLFFKKLTMLIPLFKNFYVSMVHAFLIFLPAIYYSLSFEDMDKTLVVVLFAFVFTEAIISQISLDLKDVLSDKERGLKTLGAMLGKKKACKVVLIVSLLSGVTYFVLFWLYMEAVYLILVLVTLFTNLLIYYWIQKGDKRGYLLSASKFAVWFFLLLFLV